MFESSVDRRSFLRGSAFFATALGLTVVAPAAAQEQQQQKPEEKQEKKDPFAENQNKSSEKTLVDEDGREYRICPQCAYNMYKQGRMWVCENCGYSYVE